MFRKYRSLIFSTLLILLFLEILIGFPIHIELKDTETPVAQLPQESTGAEQRMEGVHLVESSAGARDWELFAEAAEGYQGKGTWELKNVKVLFYNNDLLDFTVVGKTGRIDTKTKDMNITGDVQTTSKNGYQFSSNSIDYTASERKLHTNDKVKMLGPPDEKGKGLVMESNKMLALIEKSLMTLQENVVGKKILSNGKSFFVKSSFADFSSENKSVRFYEQVSIEVDTLKMVGPEATFNYSTDTDFLQSILVKGGVKVSDVDKYATAETVRFEPSENKFIFNGRPRVVQNNDEIQGEQIVFIDGGKKVKVENMRARVEKKE